MPLAPLADLLAFHAPDPELRRHAERRLSEGGFWHRILASEQWVLAQRAHYASSLDSELLTKNGLAFAEGRRRLLPLESSGAVAGLLARLEAPERLDTLPGDFTFFRLQSGGRVTAVRGVSGRVPLYYFAERDRVIVSTRFVELARLMPEIRLDPLANAAYSWIEPALPHDRAFLRDTYVIPNGCVAELRPGRRRVRSYWSPFCSALPRPSARAAGLHRERFAALLERHLAEEIDPSGGNLLTLSGGVDSSALAAVIRRRVQRPLMTLSFVPPADHPARRRELGFISPLVGELGIEQSWLIDATQEVFSALLASAPAVPFYFAHVGWAQVARLQKQASIRVMVGGELADELFGGPPRLPDWSRAAGLRDVLRFPAELPTGSKDYGRWLKHHGLELSGRPLLPLPRPLPELFRREVREEHAEWVADRGRELRRLPPSHRLFVALLATDVWKAMHWEAGSTLDTRRPFPFHSREMIELAAELHPLELFGPGTKKILRGALSDAVPKRNLQRADKGYWAGWRNDPVPWSQPLPEALASVVDARFFECPPASLRRMEHGVLTPLMVFTQSLERAAEHLRPK